MTLERLGLGSATVVGMLDLSEVFDTTSHGIFQDLQCFFSFLKRGFQLAVLHRSGSRLHICEVLQVQGLMIFQFLFNTHMKSLEENIHQCRIPNSTSQS